ncbi:hypothetical protein HAX54_005008 [Datura stramonium]|uniref:Uncharacterized protein n=1 Tax=Datura stramonium TaxID=4076 RepID=A0ABS8RU84_DATST|nr:hypothetical protein [Datura stramonium]
MERYNSNARNRSFNRTLNDSNFTPTHMPGNGILPNLKSSSSNTMIDLNISYYPDDIELAGQDINEMIQNTQFLFQRGGIFISETSRIVSDFSAYPISSIQQTFIQRDNSSRLQSPSLVHRMINSSFVETPSIFHIPRTNNARSSLQMKNLWLAPITSSSQSMHFPRASRIAPLDNSNHVTSSEQDTDFHDGSSSSPINQSNIFIQPSVAHMMMRDLPEFVLRY